MWQQFLSFLRELKLRLTSMTPKYPNDRMPESWLLRKELHNGENDS